VNRTRGLQVRTRDAGSVLHAEVSGEMDLMRALALYDRLIERWRGTEASALLIDCVKVTGTLTSVQRYEAGARVAASYATIREWGGVPPRIAIVARPPLMDPNRFMETVASNRGALMRVFLTPQEAAEWLELDLEALTAPAVPLD